MLTKVQAGEKSALAPKRPRDAPHQLVAHPVGDNKHFKALPEARRFETPYRSLQGWLWELDETLWHLAKRLPDYAPRKKRRKTPMPLQLPLLEDPPVAQE